MKSQGIKIKENVSLSRYTSFKIGGPAKFFCEVTNEYELEEAVKFARSQKLAAFLLGGGSNLVISDDGFDGLVIKIASDKPQYKMSSQNGKIYLECWAGESLGSIVNMACQSGMPGLEWAAGIPGTLGGAIRGNAGAYGGSISDCTESVKVMTLGDLQFVVKGPEEESSSSYKLRMMNYENGECKFGYRNSRFKENEDLVVVSAVLRFDKGGNKAELEAKAKEIIGKRNDKYPKFPSAGSFFQNPVVDNPELIARFERDINDKCREKKIAAGWLITEAGLKGKKVGNIQVSEEHSNFLINLGGGKAADVVMLASIIKQKVRDVLGVQLLEEVRYVGF